VYRVNAGYFEIVGILIMLQPHADRKDKIFLAPN
jgi:hypothetical protein